MNLLKGQTCYLAGFIDDAKDDSAFAWRKDITKFLHSLNIGVYSPTDKPIINTNVIENKDFVEHISSLKRTNPVKAAEIMKEIVRQDLKMVDVSNFLIVNIDKTCHMAGSYSELTYGVMQRKPCLIYCKQGVEAISNWVYGLGDLQLFFDNWDKLKQYIVQVNAGLQDDLDKKWRFFDYSKVFGTITQEPSLSANEND